MDEHDSHGLPATDAEDEARFVEFQEGTGHGELGRQKNLTRSTRGKILQKVFLGCGVIGMVKQVCYGQYKNAPAAIIVFTFNFRSGNSALRFKKANINITLDKQPGNNNSKDPDVQNWAPRKIYGIPNDELKTWAYYFELQGSATGGPAQPGPKGGVSRRSVFGKQHRMSIVGKRWASPSHSHYNIAYWEVSEQGKTKYGIPDEIHLAVLVHHDGPFQASIEVVADTPLKSNLFGFPWPKDDPVLFNPGEPKGEQIGVSDFGNLSDEDWQGLVPWDQEWKNVLTGIPSAGSSSDVSGSPVPLPLGNSASPENEEPPHA